MKLPITRFLQLTTVTLATLLVALSAASSDGGRTRWTASLIGPVAKSVAIDPTDSAIAYAATDAGIYKTTDRGQRWTLVQSPHYATAIAVDPQNHSTVVAGKIVSLGQTMNSQIQRSDDSGATWSDVDSFQFHGQVMALAFDRTQAGTVYAAMLENGIARSADGGKTWTLVNRGLRCCAPGSDFLWTQDVATSGITSSSVYAASDDVVYRSADGGQTWQSIAPLTRFEPYKISIDPNDSARLYVSGWFLPDSAPEYPFYGPGTFTSGDSGQHWQQLSVATTSRIAIDPHVPGTLYVAVPGYPYSARGILRSADRGANWTAFNEGLPTMEVTSIEIDGTGSLLYASTSAGVFVREIPVAPRRRSVSKR